MNIIEASESSAQAYQDADLNRFIETTSKLEELIPCLAEPIPRNVAAGVHRMMGLRAFIDRKGEKSEAAFGAARVIESAYRFPETMVPPGHPIMMAYESLDVSDPPTKSVPSAEGGYFQFDGRPGFERPVTLPTVTQLFNADGGVEVSAYLWPADGMFDYIVGSPAVLSGQDTAIDFRKKGPNLPLAISAAGSGLAAGVLYGLASGKNAQFNSPGAPYEDGASLRASANTYALASGSAGVVAVGLVVGSVVAGKW
ncbi:MAG: hypothetical protein GWP91_20500 [Rhodobacterales bacterium]|nr:hypothetical protein [Rhodobacterales bacterium]